MGAMSPRRIRSMAKKFEIYRLVKSLNGQVTFTEISRQTGIPYDLVRFHAKGMKLSVINRKADNLENIRHPDTVSLINGEHTKYERKVGID